MTFVPHFRCSILFGPASQLATCCASDFAPFSPRDQDLRTRGYRHGSPHRLPSHSFVHRVIRIPRPPFVFSFPRFRYPDRMLSTFFPTTYNFFLAVTLLFASVGAIPLPGISEVAERDLETRGASLLSATTISSFTSFTQFARAAYCQQSKVKNWSCGRKSS